MISFLNASGHAMLLCLIGTIILGAITGFVSVGEGALFRTLGGQIVHGVLSIACLVLVGVAFWRFGWKIGLLDFFLVIIAAKAGLTL
jgi:uncharacterized membrane protein SpoIIM required for sporulation